jgi:hypothetical protein
VQADGHVHGLNEHAGAHFGQLHERLAQLLREHEHLHQVVAHHCLRLGV